MASSAPAPAVRGTIVVTESKKSLDELEAELNAIQESLQPPIKLPDNTSWAYTKDEYGGEMYTCEVSQVEAGTGTTVITLPTYEQLNRFNEFMREHQNSGWSTHRKKLECDGASLACQVIIMMTPPVAKRNIWPTRYFVEWRMLKQATPTTIVASASSDGEPLLTRDPPTKVVK